MEDEDSITELPVLVHPECKKKAMRNSAYGEAVYTEKQKMEAEHPTPECPNCGNNKTRPLDNEWATCFDCEDNWMMTEKTQKKIADTNK